jgi:hypothetical protein
VLFVDDDQAEIFERQEQRRSRPCRNLHLAGRHLPPHLFAGAGRKVGMPFGRFGAEAILEAFEEGRGQGNFRQQDQHLPALPQRFRDRLEIDLRLARPRHPVDQGDGKTALADMAANLFGRVLLRALEPRRRIIRIGRSHHRRRRQEHRFEQPLRDEPVDDAG